MHVIRHGLGFQQPRFGSLPCSSFLRSALLISLVICLSPCLLYATPSQYDVSVIIGFDTFDKSGFASFQEALTWAIGLAKGNQIACDAAHTQGCYEEVLHLGDTTSYIYIPPPGLLATFIITVTNVVNPNIFDPNPDLLVEDNGKVRIINDPEMLAQASVVRKGAVTDGVTQLLLSLEIPDSQILNSVAFAMKRGNIEDGDLSSIGGSEHEANVTVTPQEVSSGSFFAFAIYTVPEVFSLQATTDSSRTVSVMIKSNDSSIDTEVPIILERPPVVCVHGIGADSATCMTLINLLHAHNFSAIAADYGEDRWDTYDPAIPLGINKPVIAVINAIEEVKNANLDRGIATTQVNVVAHSMGGLVVRARTKKIYERIDNFMAGDINRLITVGTPHFGANMVNFVQRHPCLADVLLQKWRTDSLGFQALAVDSQQQPNYAQRNVNSDIQGTSLTAFEVPTHVMTGFMNSTQESRIEDFVKDEYEKACGSNPPFLGIRAINMGEASDPLVAVSSQRGFVGPFSSQETSVSGLVHSTEFHDEPCKDPISRACIFAPNRTDAEMESPTVLNTIINFLNDPSLQGSSNYNCFDQNSKRCRN